MKIKEVLINGSRRPCNIINYLYFSWTLENIDKQNNIELIIKNKEKIIYTHKFNSSKQYLELYLNLKENTKYHYTLIINNTIEYADYFYSGLVNGFDLKTKWIGTGSHVVSYSEAIGNKAVYFRKTIKIDKKPEFSIVNMVGLGLFELRINNKKVGKRVLDPAFTEYDKLVLYSTFDVNEYLIEGENEIEVIVGDGWYNQTTNDTWGFSHAPWKDTVKLLFEMDYDDNKLCSDTTWNYSFGEITSNAIRVGEIHDFNIKKEYYAACLTTPPGGLLQPSYIEGIEEAKTFSPVIVKEFENKKIYDFGVNMAGYCSIVFNGNKNDVIKIQYSDRLEDNHLDNTSNSMYIFNPNVEYQIDTCILSGNIDIYHPKFVYHGFRYVLIEGNVNIKDIKAYLVRTNFKKEGYFHSSNDILNKLYDMSIQAIESNYVGFPSDCPHREKNGWTGDAQLSLETAVYTFNMHQAYKKWLNDFIVAQRPCGQIPCIIPTCGWGFNWGSGPAWDIAMFRITDALYHYYGDLNAMENIYPSLEKYFNYLITNSDNYLLSIGLGDWNYPKNITFEICDTTLISSANFMQMAKYLSKFSKLLNLKKEEYYDQISEKIKNAIIQKYHNATSLTGLACLTYFNIENKIDDIVNYLIKNDYSIHMGILGVKYVLDSLTRYNKIEIGIKILMRKEYPSFRYWIDHGQTTLCEDFELTNSLNHHMFSPITEFMLKGLAGVTIKEDGSILLNPSNNNINIDCFVPTNVGVYHIIVENNQLNISIPSNGIVWYKDKTYTMGNYILEI